MGQAAKWFPILGGAGTPGTSEVLDSDAKTGNLSLLCMVRFLSSFGWRDDAGRIPRIATKVCSDIFSGSHHSTSSLPAFKLVLGEALFRWLGHQMVTLIGSRSPIG